MIVCACLLNVGEAEINGRSNVEDLAFIHAHEHSPFLQNFCLFQTKMAGHVLQNPI